MKPGGRHLSPATPFRHRDGISGDWDGLPFFGNGRFLRLLALGQQPTQIASGAIVVLKADKARVIEKWCAKKGKPLPWEEETPPADRTEPPSAGTQEENRV